MILAVLPSVDDITWLLCNVTLLPRHVIWLPSDVICSRSCELYEFSVTSLGHLVTSLDRCRDVTQSSASDLAKWAGTTNILRDQSSPFGCRGFQDSSKS